MLKTGLSYPTTCLAILTLSTVTLAQSQRAHAADNNFTIGVSDQMMPFILQPLSRLVTSPFADARMIENPLGVEQTITPKSEAIRLLASQAEPPAAKPSTSALADSVNEPAGKTAILQVRDYTFSTAMPIRVEKGPLSAKTALAMIGQ